MVSNARARLENYNGNGFAGICDSIALSGDEMDRFALPCFDLYGPCADRYLHGAGKAFDGYALLAGEKSYENTPLLSKVDPFSLMPREQWR